jgi:hypothetical protein
MFIPSHMIWELYNQEQQHQSQMKARTQSASPVAIGTTCLSGSAGSLRRAILTVAPLRNWSVLPDLIHLA